ncbi:sialate O-acetylesterase [Cystobacter fuscus]|uniref:sialate O-acetylesterase n=1 Tax=Cystobacter fuscus TaxID=43 RepID=UPI002B303223|nr:DUF4214 domain-containing protein [Cystobacter fuscus]
MLPGHSFHGLSSLALFATAMALPTLANAAPTENDSTAIVMGSTAITGIHDNEIFQRAGTKPDSVARISVNLTSTPSTATYTYYSISLLNGGNTRERVLSEGVYTGASLLDFSLATGNSRRKVRVSFYDASNTERLRWDSPGFSVGEVFMIAGQSNVGSHGDTEGTVFTANALHRAVDPTGAISWLPVTEPLAYTTASGGRYYGSPWASFADNLSSRLGVPVAVLNASWGGSALEYWASTVTPATTRVKDQNGNPVVLFERLKLGASALKRLTATRGQLQCGFRAVLWHQGESNSEREFTTDPNEPQQPSRTWYAAKLKELAQDFRDITGCTQPWMVASATWLAPHYRVGDGLSLATKWAAETEIRKGQRYLANREPVTSNEPVFLQGPDTDMLIGEDPLWTPPGPRAYRWDGIHMTRQGLNLHGRLWSERVAGMLGAGSVLVEKDLVPEVAKVWNMFSTTLGRTPEEMNLDNEGLRYWVQVLTTNPGSATEAIIQSTLQGSDEFFIRDTFRRTVNRRPSSWETYYWATEMSAGRITRDNLASATRVGYENTLTPNAKRVFLLYVNVMGRTLPEITADTNGMDYWTRVLDSNPASEAAIAESFRTSPEYRVRTAFVKSKGRQPTLAELRTFIPKVTSSTTPTDAWLANDVWVNAAD